MTDSAPQPVTLNATAHPAHWQSILNLLLNIAPLGAAISANFTSPTVTQQVTSSVQLAEAVAPIVIQIAGIQPPQPPSPPAQ